MPKKYIKTLKGWEKSNIDLSEYLIFPCEIYEGLFNYIAECVAPKYIKDGLIQGGDPEYSRDSHDKSPEKQVFFYMSLSIISGRYFYLGILPEFRY